MRKKKKILLYIPRNSHSMLWISCYPGKHVTEKSKTLRQGWQDYYDYFLGLLGPHLWPTGVLPSSSNINLHHNYI